MLNPEGKERVVNYPPAPLFEQFLQGRAYLKNVRPRTLVWYRTAFKNYQAALTRHLRYRRRRPCSSLSSRCVTEACVR
jgi:hypothetical protein